MRTYATLLAAAALAVVASASALRAETYGSSSAPIHLTWLMTSDESPQSTMDVVKNYYTAKIQAWSKAHPDVYLDLSYQGTDINAEMTRLQEEAAAGRAPDFAMVDSFFLARFYDKLQPLDAYYTADEVNDFVPFAKAGMHGPDGKLKALWFNTDVRLMYYRKDLVPTPPKTWDDVLAVGADLAKKGLTAYIYPGGRGEASVMEHLPMFWAQGGKLVDDNGKPVFGEGDNRTYLLNVLNFMKKTVDAGVSPTRVDNYRFESDMYPELLKGNVAMFVGGSWQGQSLRNLGSKDTWSIADIPMPAGKGPSTAAGGWTVGVFTPDVEKQKLAVDLINTLLISPDAMAAATEADGSLPTRISVAAMNTPYLSNPDTKAFSAMLAYGQARPGAAIYPTISTELQVAISNVISGQQSPEDALDQAWKKVLQEAGN